MNDIMCVLVLFNTTQDALLICLQGIFFLLFITFGPLILIDYFFPKAHLTKRCGRLLVSVLIRSPLKAIHWLLKQFFAPRQPLRLHQIFLDNYPLSPLEFYGFVEAALQRRQLPDLRVARVRRREWHPISASRLYLRLQYHTSVCFIGGTPFGTGFLISWRYGELPAKFLIVLFAVPYLGRIAERLLHPPTYYRADVHIALEHAIRAGVLDAMQQLAHARRLRLLTEAEQRPLLREFYEG